MRPPLTPIPMARSRKDARGGHARTRGRCPSAGCDYCGASRQHAQTRQREAADAALAEWHAPAWEGYDPDAA